jgi:hypothetical protein
VAVLGAVACGLALALPASAIQILQGGTNGGPGQDGGDAVAVAISADPSNSAGAFGGTGGTPGLVPTSGGDASATAETQVSGEASASATADGGRGGDGLGTVAAGPGGAAQASAVAENTSAESVNVYASAKGGHGGELALNGGAGGQASLGRVYGASSGGGAVNVRATLTGGEGGTGEQAGAGASVALQNAVDGDTSGALYLEQRAVGGDPGFGSGASPMAGSAESSLTVEKSAASLELVSEAFAGGRLGAISGVTFPGSGADATAIAEGSNSSGSATTRAFAVAGAGLGNDSGTPPGVGGEANLRATAKTVGDGHAVRVGEAPVPNPPFPPEMRTGAIGGRGGPAPGFPAIAPGRGGDARSLSIGTALGDSTVYVFDHALGGSGGGCVIILFGCGLTAGGGDASSEAIGEGAGHSSVEVHALAEGGQGGFRGEDSPRGGASVASASASGLGEVHATAEARPGGNQVGGIFFLSARPIALSGDASALATGLGSSGSAEAIAAARGGVMDRMALYAGASIATGASAEAQASAARSFSASDAPTTSDVLVRAAALPLAEDSQQVLEDNPGIEAAFAAAGVDEMLALGRIQMRSSQLADTDSILLSGAASFDVLAALVAVSELPRPGNVWVSFFAPELEGEGFESLRVRLARNDVDVVDLLFTDPDEARSGLDQLAFDLGAIRDVPPPGDPQPPLLAAGNFTLDLELLVRDVDDSFGVGFLVGSTPIPEPSTLLLVGIGLAVLAFRRSRA